MCMIVTVKVVGADRDALRPLADRLDGPIAPFGVDEDGAAGEHGLAAHGCDLLAEDADWDAPTWAMTPEAIDELALAWRAVFAEAPDVVTVAAIWSDDAVRAEAALTRNEFLDLSATGRIGTHTRYTIARSSSL